MAILFPAFRLFMASSTARVKVARIAGVPLKRKPRSRGLFKAEQMLKLLPDADSLLGDQEIGRMQNSTLGILRLPILMKSISSEP